MSKIDLKEIKKNSIEIVEPDFSYIDGKYLRDFRIKLSFSQSVLADYLGVTKKAIEKWEQGKNKMNPIAVRMVYLIEKEPQILSLLKVIKVNNEPLKIRKLSEYDVIVNNIKNMNDYYNYNEITEEKIKSTEKDYYIKDNHIINYVKETVKNACSCV